MKRLVLVLIAVIAVSACRRTPPQQAEWGQGYETQSGYMQPDHSWFYYWFMYHMLFSDPAPSYHVYYPPAGYPSTYRPWNTTPPPPVMTTRPSDPKPDSRKTGGFGSAPPSAPESKPSSRTTGGFSSPPSSGSSRTSGGSSSRTSGGFSGGGKKR